MTISGGTRCDIVALPIVHLLLRFWVSGPCHCEWSNIDTMDTLLEAHPSPPSQTSMMSRIFEHSPDINFTKVIDVMDQ